MIAERAFSRIAIFEQRANVGGLWNYIACPDDATRGVVPQTNPHAERDEPIWQDNDARGVPDQQTSDQAEFMSPVYDRLETNIPRGLMGFSDLNWPDDCQLFPGHDGVLKYIECYAEHLQHLIQLQTQVLEVKRSPDGHWVVKSKRLARKEANNVEEQVFDAVVVANGHFNVPYIPSVPGIDAWNEAYPGTILHSKFYRKPEQYGGEKVIIVGNSASGVDIGSQVAMTCKSPMLVSQKSESFLQPETSSTKVEKPEIVEYVVRDRRVRFADGSTESGVDAILYCTGCFYSYPFLKSLDPPVVTTGEYVENLYQHVFYRPDPTLAFVALNQKVIPFPIAEAQAAVIARVWSGRLSLPTELEMRDWERQTLQETGGGRNFHVLKFPKDADYINMLHDWAMSTTHDGDGDSTHTELRKRRMSSSSSERQRKPDSNGSTASIGKEPPYWGEEEYWTRERFPAIKKAFQGFGEERHGKRTLDDVGFSFEEWQQERAEEGRRLL